MKTIQLRELIRAPKKVQKWTHAGLSVKVTDDGAPLWVVTPDPAAVGQVTRHEAIEEELAGLLESPPAKTSLSRLINRSRP